MLSTDDLERILDRIQTWTRSVDQRTGVLLGFESAVWGLLLIRIPDLFARLSDRRWTHGIILVGFGFLAIALLQAMMALFPRVGRKPLLEMLKDWWMIAPEAA